MQLDAVPVIPAHEVLEQQARKKAEQLVRMVQGTSALEAQGVSARHIGQMVKKTIHELLAGSLGHRVRRARELAGLPDDVKLYGVRHAFGARGIIAGCDIKTLSVLMGHTDTKMTEHYVHIAGKRDFLASAMQQINRPTVAAKTSAKDPS